MPRRCGRLVNSAASARRIGIQLAQHGAQSANAPLHCAITQPDHEIREQRTPASFTRTICKRFSPRAQQRISELKLFKYFQGLADPIAERKSYYITMTYAWWSKRSSNRQSGCSKLPFEIAQPIAENRPPEKIWRFVGTL